jgi:hypothetical protein
MWPGGSGVSAGSGGKSKRCCQGGGFRAIVRNRHKTVVPDFLLRCQVVDARRSGRWRRTFSARLFGEMLLAGYTISALLASAMNRPLLARIARIRCYRWDKRGLAFHSFRILAPSRLSRREPVRGSSRL